MTNETDITRVLIEPSRIKNCSRFIFPIISEPMIAAWLLPSPGKKEHIGETKIVAIVGLMISFLLIFNFFIICFGTTVLDFIEWIIVEVPNNPVSRGSSGYCISRLSVASPKKPANIKIKMAWILNFFSL